MEVVEAAFWIPFLMAASAVYSGASQAMAAQASAKAAQDAADYNAEVARKQAESETSAKTEEARQLTQKQRGMTAKQVMSVSSRGGFLAGGDLKSIEYEQNKMATDALNLMYQGDQATSRGEIQAQQAQYQCKMEKTKAKWTERAGYINAITGGITGYYGGKDMVSK